MENGGWRRWAPLIAGVLSVWFGRAAAADPAINIGVITDLSGIYANLSGEGSAEAARMAVEDFGGRVLGRPIRVLVADHHHDTKLAVSIADQWATREHVGMFVDMPDSSVALAVQKYAGDHKRISVTVSAGSTDLTGRACTDTGFHWVYDTYSNSTVVTRVTVAFGLDSWYLLTADYDFGWSLENEARKSLEHFGGSVVGAARHPSTTTDFHAYLHTALASKAKVLGLASAGENVVNIVRQMAADRTADNGDAPVLVPLLVFISDIHTLGLELAQGMTFLTGFYWDEDAQTRQWSHRFFDRRHVMPTMSHAGVYSAVTHYLRAVEAVGTDDAKIVAEAMRGSTVNDFFAKNGRIRRDGRMVHDMLLVRVRRPDESRYPWDYYEILTAVRGDRAFRPLEESDCPRK